MNKRDLIKRINKIRNVEFENNEIIFDEISQKNYNNTLKELSRIENTYNVDLNYLRNELKKQRSELQRYINRSNKNGNDNNSLIDVERESGLLNQIEDTIHYLNPNRKSEVYKQETLEILKQTQKHNQDIAEFELDYWVELTGLNRDTIDRYLFPTGEEEKSWYEQYLELVEYGYEEENARVITNKMYNENKINNHDVYNMTDIIEHFVPKAKQTQAREFLNKMTKIRLLNMRAR